jgi:tellurite resistance protein TehA-like permease
MKDTAPKLAGMIVVAAMFGLLSVGVSTVVLELERSSIALIGSGVFALVFVILALGWREPQDGPNRPTR